MNTGDILLIIGFVGGTVGFIFNGYWTRRQTIAFEEQNAIMLAEAAGAPMPTNLRSLRAPSQRFSIGLWLSRYWPLAITWLLFFMALFVGVADFWTRYYPEPIMRKLSASDARVTVVGILPAYNLPSNQACTNIYVANESDVIARGPDMRPINFVGPLSSELQQKDLDLRFVLLLFQSVPPNSFFADELTPIKNLPADLAHGTYTTVCFDKGKLTSDLRYSYILGMVLWRDDGMASDEIGVTEICGNYIGDPTQSAFHYCYSHNRSYVVKRPPEPKY